MRIVESSHSFPMRRYSSLSLHHNCSMNRAAPYSLHDSSQPDWSSRVSLLRDGANSSSRASLSSDSGSMDLPSPQAVSSPTTLQVDSLARRITRFPRQLVRNVSELLKVAPGWHAIVVKASIFFLADTFVSGSVWEKEAAMVKSAGESLSTIYNLNQQYRTHPNIAAKAVCLPLEPCECFLHISTDIVH